MSAIAAGLSAVGRFHRGRAWPSASALLIAPFIVAYKQPDPEKLSAYECGFNAFDDARMKFDVRFYLVADPFHHLRSRGELPVPLGGGLPQDRAIWLLVDDACSLAF